MVGTVWSKTKHRKQELRATIEFDIWREEVGKKSWKPSWYDLQEARSRRSLSAVVLYINKVTQAFKIPEMTLN